MTNTIDIKNKRASFEYEFLEKHIAGIQLTGTEIKSIREGQANLTDAYCMFENNEMFVKSMHISEYKYGSVYNHEPKRPRKLLLRKQELNKLKRKSEEKSLTLVPIRLFINEKGLAKLEIALAKGKKTYDKREDIKKRDIKRDISREMKDS
jgi:SsrA-binding protein